MSKSKNPYAKHMTSSKKKFVATFPDGKVVQANNQEEFTKLQKEYLETLPPVKKLEKVIPKFDPDTGERIN